MSTNESQPQHINTLAFALAAVMLSTLLGLILFFVIGGIFGPITDVLQAISAVACALFALRLFAVHRQASSLAMTALIFTWIGAVLNMIGSYLVVSGTTGYFLSGLVSVLGWAFIGLWLLLIAFSAVDLVIPTRAIQIFTFITAVTLCFGFLAIPGILLQIDNPNTPSPLVTSSQVGFLGSLLLLPAWMLALGIRTRRSHNKFG